MGKILAASSDVSEVAYVMADKPRSDPRGNSEVRPILAAGARWYEVARAPPQRRGPRVRTLDRHS